ncbi:MAG: N-acetyltransferase [Micrococcales bacterium]|nr:N-acetyltransferase [Micrococcales bacterium]
MNRHALADVLEAARLGRHPAPDGGWTRLPRYRAGTDAVVALTGHAYLCTETALTDDELTALGVDGIGGAHAPQVALALAGAGGWMDVLDAVLLGVGRGRPDGALARRPDLDLHPRVVHGGRMREDVVAWGYRDLARTDVVSVGRGVGGLLEIGLEVATPGQGSTIVSDTLDAMPAGETVVASVSPGNARSLRAFLRAGFVPIGSVQVIVPRD